MHQGKNGPNSLGLGKKSVVWLFIAGLALTFMPTASAQEISKETRGEMGQYLTRVARRQSESGRIRVDSAKVEQKKITLFATDNCAYIPFREDNVKEIYDTLRNMLPADLQKRTLQLVSDGMPIEEMIPIGLREVAPKKLLGFKTQNVPQLVRRADGPQYKKGLQGRHIGMWQSHGWYYEAKLDRWEWQRARILQTVEDLYTQSYVLPFLVPMLENAGANVLLPRERDTNPIEVIVDGDGNLAQNGYKETSGDKSWANGSGNGFAYKREVYINDENPFCEGTFRQIETIQKGQESKAVWTPDLPETREYAVYVSYKTLPQSVSDAQYTVFHGGQQTTFKVNQQMGGGTWIYLGTFKFDKGHSENNRIELSNLSASKKGVVTADAIKIGGGMGNIGRYINLNVDEKDQKPITLDEAQISGYPRFCEGARYWMQWAGVPDSIYNLTNWRNDYVDDYKNRGLWINWLAGGSEVNRNYGGLNIPMDLSFAFHSDAGTTLDDTTIGTLAIYDKEHYDGKFFNGAPTSANHQLADLVQSNIVDDVRYLYAPDWNRRGIWNKPYFEAWMPKVPAMLLELLSHQNFADMRYGLDPRFRFTVSRGVYKGILKFIASQRGEEFVVQPLPVKHFAMQVKGTDEVELSWQPTPDDLEPTAKPDKYMVYTRIGNGDWDNGIVCDDTHFTAKVESGKVCSWKVVAMNDGGISFPSEILSAGRPDGQSLQDAVLVINGFDRISAPADFVAPEGAGKKLAGFLDDLDHGVPYLKNINYIGQQKEFRREIPWMDDDASGFGDSYGDYETQVIAGNTFDYPAVHGAAIMKAGKAFISSSDEAVEDETVKLAGFKTVDLILGKECQTKMGDGKFYPIDFKTFNDKMQRQITAYTAQGGNIFVSGQFVGTDLWDNHIVKPVKADQTFAEDVLKYKWRAGQAVKGGGLKGAKGTLLSIKGHFGFSDHLNSQCYVVESPDAIEPATKDGQTVLRYAQNNLSAAVAYKGNYRTFVMGVPFETINTPEERESLMKVILDFFEK